MFLASSRASCGILQLARKFSSSPSAALEHGDCLQSMDSHAFVTTSPRWFNPYTHLSPFFKGCGPTGRTILFTNLDNRCIFVTRASCRAFLYCSLLCFHCAWLFSFATFCTYSKIAAITRIPLSLLHGQDSELAVTSWKGLQSIGYPLKNLCFLIRLIHVEPLNMFSRSLALPWLKSLSCRISQNSNTCSATQPGGRGRPFGCSVVGRMSAKD